MRYTVVIRSPTGGYQLDLSPRQARDIMNQLSKRYETTQKSNGNTIIVEYEKEREQ